MSSASRQNTASSGSSQARNRFRAVRDRFRQAADVVARNNVYAHREPSQIDKAIERGFGRLLGRSGKDSQVRQSHEVPPPRGPENSNRANWDELEEARRAAQARREAEQAAGGGNHSGVHGLGISFHGNDIPPLVREQPDFIQRHDGDLSGTIREVPNLPQQREQYHHPTVIQSVVASYGGLEGGAGPRLSREDSFDSVNTPSQHLARHPSSSQGDLNRSPSPGSHRSQHRRSPSVGSQLDNRGFSLYQGVVEPGTKRAHRASWLNREERQPSPPPSSRSRRSSLDQPHLQVPRTGIEPHASMHSRTQPPSPAARPVSRGRTSDTSHQIPRKPLPKRA